MSRSKGTKQSFTIDEYAFFLNLRGTPRSGMTKQLMVDKLGSVTENEVGMLDKYKNIMSDSEYVQELQSKGWFQKNYETVKKNAESHFAKIGKALVYNKPAKKTSEHDDVTKLLFFCKLLGEEIIPKQIKLVQEQQEVVDIPVGMKLVNSGPGTGKTTTGVFAAAKYMHEGVLVVAYTNAAVKNFIRHLSEIVPDIKQVSSDPDKKIWVTTIDTICRSNNRGIYKNVKFDRRIEASNRDLPQKTDIFVSNENDMKYQHLIIDEAQDIDDDRFKYLFNIHRTFVKKSMTIIGDPRQRMNINAGGIFQKLFGCGIPKDVYLKDKAVEWNATEFRWSSTSDEANEVIMDDDKVIDGDEEMSAVQAVVRDISRDWFMNARPLIFKYHVTFRMRNPILLQIANDLSSIRPNIHTEFQLHDSIEKSEATKVTRFNNIQDLVSEIDALIESGVRPSQICLMSPITQKTSKIMRNFRDIQQLLSTRQIICSDELQDSTIYASSIISAKGLEFDHVFFIGVSRFPSYLQGTLEDVNDGMSMNFVANTRARVQMYYLTDATNLPPDNVSQDYITGEYVQRPNFAKLEIYRRAIRSTEIDPSDYEDFEKRNRPFLRIVQKDLVQNNFEKNKYHSFLYEIICYVLSEIGGFNKFQLDRDYGVMEDKTFREHLRTCQLTECETNIKGKDVLVISESMKELVGDGIEMVRNYSYMMNNRESLLQDLNQIIEPTTQISKLITTLIGGKENETAQHSTFGKYLKAPLICGIGYAVIFTESIFLAAELKRTNPRRRVVMIGLETSRFIEITSVPSNHRRYSKVCQDLFVLTAHLKLMQERGKFTMAELDSEKELFFTDSEFTPSAWNKSGSIYEIAVINALKPYCSFITYLKPDPNRFNIHVGDQTLRLTDLDDAPSVNEFVAVFSTFVNPNRTTIYYFHAMHDVSPFYETHNSFSNAWGYGEESDQISQEPKDWKFDPTGDYGYTFRNGRAGNGAGKLNEVYNRTTGSMLLVMPHLIHHVAISDALMLLEYVLTRDYPAQRSMVKAAVVSDDE